MPPKRPTTVPPIPLDFKEAVSRLLKVKPLPRSKRAKPKVKKRPS